MRSAMFMLCIAVISPAIAATPDDSAVDKIFPRHDKPASRDVHWASSGTGTSSTGVGYGEGAWSLPVPLTSKSVFYMGSVSSSSLRRVLLSSSAAGFLSLDDDVHKYIPELPDYGRPITLKEMLHHTSGFGTTWVS